MAAGPYSIRSVPEDTARPMPVRMDPKTYRICADFLGAGQVLYGVKHAATTLAGLWLGHLGPNAKPYLIEVAIAWLEVMISLGVLYYMPPGRQWMLMVNPIALAAWEAGYLLGG